MSKMSAMEGYPGAGEEKMKRLLNLQRRQYGMMVEMRQATADMAETDDEALPDKISAIVEKRQRCLDEAVALSVEMHQLREQIIYEAGGKNGMAELTGEPALIWEEIAREDRLILQLAEQIKELDLQQERRIKGLLLNYKTQIEKIRAGRQTAEAYGKNPSTPKSIFVDKKK